MDVPRKGVCQLECQLECLGEVPQEAALEDGTAPCVVLDRGRWKCVPVPALLPAVGRAGFRLYSRFIPPLIRRESMPAIGDLVQMVSPKGKRYLLRVGAQDALHTHDGVIPMEDIQNAVYGATLMSHKGKPYRLLRPTLYDLVKGVKRQTQIIYPKDIGYICMKLGVGPGRRIIEAGSGSGSLTVAMSWFAGESGVIYTYEQRPEFFDLCRRNLEWAGLGGNVEQFNQDIAEGFLQTGVDALFLDVRTPWDYLEQAAAAVAPGAPLGFLLPTVNQVSELIAGLEQGPFAGIEVLEILLRRYKPVPDRLRPDDRMVAHTGFLVFARQQEPGLQGEIPVLPGKEPLPETQGEEESPAASGTEMPGAEISGSDTSEEAAQGETHAASLGAQDPAPEEG